MSVRHSMEYRSVVVVGTATEIADPRLGPGIVVPLEVARWRRPGPPRR